MRLRGTKFLKKHIDSRIQSTGIDTMDGILWSIDSTTNTARIKIQGSNNYIVAHYPRNWKTVPYWLKLGSSVRVTFRGGKHGYCEVSGEGRAIPSPVSGSLLPDVTGTDDEILDGLEITATNPVSNIVNISVGSFRLNGTVYYYNTTNITIDLTSYIPSDSTLFCYVGIVIGDDLEFHIITSLASVNPIKPEVLSNHVLVDDYIFLQGLQPVDNWRIGGEWIAPTPNEVEVEYPETIDYNTSIIYFYVRIKDEWGNYINGNYTITIEIMSGSGTITPTTTNISSYQASFEYNKGFAEHSPLILVTVTGDNNLNLQSIFILKLLDQNGDEIW